MSHTTFYPSHRVIPTEIVGFAETRDASQLMQVVDEEGRPPSHGYKNQRFVIIKSFTQEVPGLPSTTPLTHLCAVALEAYGQQYVSYQGKVQNFRELRIHRTRNDRGFLGIRMLDYQNRFFTYQLKTHPHIRLGQAQESYCEYELIKEIPSDRLWYTMALDCLIKTLEEGDHDVAIHLFEHLSGLLTAEDAFQVYALANSCFAYDFIREHYPRTEMLESHLFTPDMDIVDVQDTLEKFFCELRDEGILLSSHAFQNHPGYTRFTPLPHFTLDVLQDYLLLNQLLLAEEHDSVTLPEIIAVVPQHKQEFKIAVQNGRLSCVEALSLQFYIRETKQSEGYIFSQTALDAARILACANISGWEPIASNEQILLQPTLLPGNNHVTTHERQLKQQLQRLVYPVAAHRFSTEFESAYSLGLSECNGRRMRRMPIKGKTDHLYLSHIFTVPNPK